MNYYQSDGFLPRNMNPSPKHKHIGIEIFIEQPIQYYPQGFRPQIKQQC